MISAIRPSHFLVIVALLFALAGLARGAGPHDTAADGADQRLMLRGYDPVTYFTTGKPMRGDPAFKTDFDGVTYHFATEENRFTFMKNPFKYVPMFGAYCANGMVYAIPLGGEPENFKIIDGRLHLFGGNRSKLYFEMDQEKNLKLADHYWESEAKDSNWRWQSWKRVWFAKVPHYKTNRDLAEEYEKRVGKKPG